MTNKQLKEMSVRIKERRESLGFTQDKFSEAIHLSLSSYTKIENAFQKPSLDTVIKIAEKLNVSLDYIIFGGTNLKEVTQSDLILALMEYADKNKISHAKEVLTRIENLLD